MGNPKGKSNPETLVQKASACLKDRDDVTTKPMYHIGKVFSWGSTDSFTLLKDTIDYLDCKGQAAKPFTDSEKEFLVNLYEAFWWGGKTTGLSEAAELANHYVHGEGKEVRLDSFIYENSLIVKDAMKAMKGYISANHAAGKNLKNLQSTDAQFHRSKHAVPLQKANRNQHLSGSILPDGGLIAEQVNLRLFYTDNRFHLRSDTEVVKTGFFTKWSVRSLYDFSPYPTTEYTNIPIKGDLKLKLPDGLSNYMEHIGIAKRFWYYADWHEHWN